MKCNYIVNHVLRLPNAINGLLLHFSKRQRKVRTNTLVTSNICVLDIQYSKIEYNIVH